MSRRLKDEKFLFIFQPHVTEVSACYGGIRMSTYNTEKPVFSRFFEQTHGGIRMSNYNTENPVFSRFFLNIPDYPHCTDHLEAGCRQCPKRVAIKRRYIEFNKPNYSYTYMTCDLDYEGSSLAWYDLDLPTPTFVVVNPGNAHSHTTYELATPVHLGGNASLKAIRYLDVIRKGYLLALDADPTFGELMSKNPLSDSWYVDSCNVTYELDRLAEPLREISTDELLSIPLEEFDERIRDYLIPLYEKRQKKSKPVISTHPDDSLFVFHNTRWYGYSITPDCKRYGELYAKIEAYIRELDADFSLNKKESRILSDAKSIAKWCWNHRADFLAARQAFCETQRERAYLSHKARKRNNQVRIQNAASRLREEGRPVTKSAIAGEAGLNKNTLTTRRVKTHLANIRSANAYQTNEIRKAATEEKIRKAIDNFLREGRPITKAAIAREVGISREAIQRYYSPLL